MSTKSTQEKITSALPEDGAPIHFEELLRRVKDNGVTRQTLSTHLKQLVKDKTVIREAMEIEGKPRMTYRLGVFLHGLDVPGYTRIFSDMITQQKGLIESTRNDEGKEILASQAVYNALWLINATIYDELTMYALNPDKEQAERRLDSALKNFILPWIRKVTELAVMPGACGQQTSVIIDQVYLEISKSWGKLWKSISVPEQKYDIETIKRKVAEIKEKMETRR